MTFDLTDIFTLVGTEQFASSLVAGVLVGFLFAGRMSAHVTITAFGFRTGVIGLVFLAGIMVSRIIDGSPQYEAWIGVGFAFVVYSAGLVIGIVAYDWHFKRLIERELGRPLRSSPRGQLTQEGAREFRRRREDQP